MTAAELTHNMDNEDMNEMEIAKPVAQLGEIDEDGKKVQDWEDNNSGEIDEDGKKGQDWEDSNINSDSEPIAKTVEMDEDPEKEQGWEDMNASDNDFSGVNSKAHVYGYGGIGDDEKQTHDQDSFRSDLDGFIHESGVNVIEHEAHVYGYDKYQFKSDGGTGSMAGLDIINTSHNNNSNNGNVLIWIIAVCIVFIVGVIIGIIAKRKHSKSGKSSKSSKSNSSISKSNNSESKASTVKKTDYGASYGTCTIESV